MRQPALPRPPCGDGPAPTFRRQRTNRVATPANFSPWWRGEHNRGAPRRVPVHRAGVVDSLLDLERGETLVPLAAVGLDALKSGAAILETRHPEAVDRQRLLVAGSALPGRFQVAEVRPDRWKRESQVSAVPANSRGRPVAVICGQLGTVARSPLQATALRRRTCAVVGSTRPSGHPAPLPASGH